MSRLFTAERAALAIVLGIGSAVLVLGWWTFLFLTDDAYIAFRYASNSRLGFGYVWNAPPFQPVEGYTSFLWIVLLESVWSLTSVEPPDSSNILSLGFSWATLMLTARVVWRLPWTSRLQNWRVEFVAWLFVYLLANRTFLAWTSSGLETAMFNFLLLAWLLALLSPAPRGVRLALAALAACGLALTRPDGLLFVVAHLGISWVCVRNSSSTFESRLALGKGALPIVVAVTHLAWRRSFYGEWLPNTYFAKITGAWPESGLRYALCFLLEYGLWLPMAVAVVAVCRAKCRAHRRTSSQSRVQRPRDLLRADLLIRALALAAVVSHLLFYTLVVGGDVFEYRVYSYVLPLVPLALFWALNRSGWSHFGVTLGIGFTFLASLPVPWTHWFLTKDLNSSRPGQKIAIAPYWPTAIREYVEPFDRAQAWLIDRNVCIRHHEHKQFWRYLVRNHPSRAEGSRISAAGFPVAAAHAVGVASWIAPHVNVIDQLGLTDFVIARTPVPEGSKRRLAHSRRPPAGYVESYRPNVTMENRRLRVSERDPPLTTVDIGRLEAQWRRLVLSQKYDSRHSRRSPAIAKEP